MFRFRVWLLSLAAALLVGGPALAYSWPVLFALPGVFGQEQTRADESAQDMPYADQCPACTRDQVRPEVIGDCLATWQKLWAQGRFREALHLAKWLAKAAPRNADAQHALAVSQVVTQLSGSAVSATLEDFGAIESRITPAGTLTPDLTIPIQKSSDLELTCPGHDCPLMGLFQAVFGGSNVAKSGCENCCPKCSASAGCGTAKGGCCEHGDHNGERHAVQLRYTQQGPTVIWILREPLPSVMGPVLQNPPVAGMTLPPPDLAPPPPPFIAPDGSAYIPVPVPTLPGQGIQQARGEQEEECELSLPPPPSADMLADVSITQRGNRVHLNCSNFEADCQRLHGVGNGGLVLEGNVVLISRRHGQTMTIRAQRVMLNPNEGHFVVENAQGMEQSRMHVAPVGYRDANERMSELLNENENIGQMRRQADRIWMIDQPTRIAPVRIHGSVGP